MFCLFYLFVCLKFIVPLENFSLIWRHHHCRWRAPNFDLCSALMAIEQWGFFNVPNLLRHGPTLYNGHLRAPMTLASVIEHLAVEPSTTCFYDLRLSRSGIEPHFPHTRRTYGIAVSNKYQNVTKSDMAMLLQPSLDLYQKYFKHSLEKHHLRRNFILISLQKSIYWIHIKQLQSLML